MTDQINCTVCETSFTPRTKTTRYCSPRCSNTAKMRRKRANPGFLARELEAQRVAYQRTKAQTYDFAAQPGYVGDMVPTKPRQRWDDECILIDREDDPIDWVPPAPRPVPRGVPEVIDFSWAEGHWLTPLSQRMAETEYVPLHDGDF